MGGMRTVRVTGKGQLKLHPDMTRITISLTGSHREYGELLRKTSEDTDKLKELFAKFGFERTDLKTQNFNIETEYEGYQEENVWKQRFIGYRFTHVLKLEFDSDNDRLGKILFALANSDTSPEFRISYTVKDPESAKNELLGKAVADAAAKAAVLTKAAGVRLMDIQSVDYSWGEISLETRPMNRMMAAGAKMAVMEEASYDMDIEPDDIEVSDTVTVVWEIE